MQTRLLSDPAGLEGEWWLLWHRDPAATPFQTPAWLISWRKHFMQGKSIVVAWRSEGRLVGLLPLSELDGRLLPWGAGTSDWLGGLFDPIVDPAEFSDGLAALPLPLDLFQLPSHSPLLHTPIPSGWAARDQQAESCPVLELPVTASTKMGQKVRYYRRRAARARAGEIERLGSEHLADLIELHTRRWNRRDEPGIFADSRVAAWQEEALPALEAAGLLYLYGIRIARKIVAALCILGAKQRRFYYIGGFDPDHASLGLGTLLLDHAIGQAQQEGCSSFDFLRGSEPYKYRWGAKDQPSFARYLFPARTPAHA